MSRKSERGLRLTVIQEALRSRIRGRMIELGMNRKELCKKLNKLGAGRFTEPTLRKRIGEAVTERVALTLPQLYSFAAALDMQPSELLPDFDALDRATLETQYAHALLNVTDGLQNPDYLIASRYPSSAVLPREMARYVHLRHFSEPQIVGSYDRLSTAVRLNFLGAKENEAPRIKNYVSHEGFETLFSSEVAAELGSNVLIGFIDDLERSTKTGSPAYQLFLVGEGCIAADFDTALIAADRIWSSRSYGSRVCWGCDDEGFRRQEARLKKITSCGFKMTTEYLEQMRKRIYTALRP